MLNALPFNSIGTINLYVSIQLMEERRSSSDFLINFSRIGRLIGSRAIKVN